MRTVGISAAERRGEAMATASLRNAVDAVRRDGYVVLLGAVDRTAIDTLRAAMDERVEVQRAAAPNVRRLQCPPPSAPALVDRAIVANPFVAQVSRAILGPRPYNNLYSTDVNCPGSAAQRLHVDAAQLWPALSQAHPAASLMINIPLVETTDRNGSTELWPGTHTDTRTDVFIADAAAEGRRAVTPPLRANVPAGSVIVRDARLWHRGMPNTSPAVRTVVTMMHHVFWLERGAPMLFPRGCEAAFTSNDLIAHVRFTETARNH